MVGIEQLQEKIKHVENALKEYEEATEDEQGG